MCNKHNNIDNHIIVLVVEIILMMVIIVRRRRKRGRGVGIRRFVFASEDDIAQLSYGTLTKEIAL